LSNTINKQTENDNIILMFLSNKKVWTTFEILASLRKTLELLKTVLESYLIYKALEHMLSTSDDNFSVTGSILVVLSAKRHFLENYWWHFKVSELQQPFKKFQIVFSTHHHISEDSCDGSER